MTDHPLQIVIPTYRRVTAQGTLSWIPGTWRTRVTLVVDEQDAAEFAGLTLNGVSILVHPPEIDSIAKKRKWIIEQERFNKIVMLDDDLRFSVREDPEATKLVPACSTDMCEHLNDLEVLLDDYVHAGWSARQGNNNVKQYGVVNGRMMFVLGYRCDILRELVAEGKVTLGRVRTREDMELGVQLMKLGLPNIVDFTIAADQVGGYGAEGGCSNERTIESTSEDARIFADLHPGVVKAVEKQYLGSPNRTEVVVYWKKAFASSFGGTSSDERTGSPSEDGLSASEDV